MKKKKEARKIIKEAEGRGALTEFESKQILSMYGIPVPKQGLARTIDEALAVAEEIGYPVALKVVSPNILHKTNAGGVKLGISSPSMVREAYIEILRKAKEYEPDADVWGILVQEMVEGEREVIVGMKRDPTFGPTVLFGLGGVFVEVLRDVALRVAPLTREDAFEMIKEIRGYPILEAYRGQPPADVESIVDIVMNVAQLAQDFRVISEMDLNPVFVREKGKGSIVVDARIILKGK